MTVRPTPEQAERLKQQADTERRSQQAVVLDAIDEYIDRHQRNQLIRKASEQGAHQYRDALNRLGQI